MALFSERFHTKSERNVFDKAMVTLAGMDVDIKPIRLDKYSVPTYVDKFDGGCRVYVMPRKNSALNGSQVEGHHERIYKGHNGTPGTVPSGRAIQNLALLLIRRCLGWVSEK